MYAEVQLPWFLRFVFVSKIYCCTFVFTIYLTELSKVLSLRTNYCYDICEWLIEKDVEVERVCLFYNITPAYPWEDWGRHIISNFQAENRIQDFPNANQHSVATLYDERLDWDGIWKVQESIFHKESEFIIAHKNLMLRR